MSKSQLSSFAFLAVVFLLIAAINANELDKAEKEILELISQKVLSSRINDYVAHNGNYDDSDELEPNHSLLERSLSSRNRGFNAWAGRRQLNKRGFSGFNAWAGKRSANYGQNQPFMEGQKRAPWGGAPSAYE